MNLKEISIPKIKLGHTDLSVSQLCFGTMYFGTRVNETDSFTLLDAYYEAGGRFIDTANKYCSWLDGFVGGESESVIGKWLKSSGVRKDLVIATKVGFDYQDVPVSLDPKIIDDECHKSLERMGIETIDLYYAHGSDPNTPIIESLNALSSLVDKQLIKYIGASNFYAWELEEAYWTSINNDLPRFCCIQQRHSYLPPAPKADFGGKQKVLTEELQSYCRRHEISLMAYSPLLAGLFSKLEKVMPEQYDIPQNKSRIQKLEAMAKKKGCSSNQLVYAWLLQGKPSIIPMVAASTLGQLSENLESLNVQLDNEEIIELSN